MGTSPARGANLDAIASATGRTWADWTAWLDDAGAREAASHGDIAALALARMREPGAPAVDNPEWWAQSVTVAYEQHIGRRMPGQRTDGTFDATASRTVAGTREDVHGRLLGVLETARADDDGRLRGVRPAREPTASMTAKRTFWRVALEDGSRTELAVEARPAADGKPAKASVTARQSKVGSPEEATAWKAFWKDLLGRL